LVRSDAHQVEFVTWLLVEAQRIGGTIQSNIVKFVAPMREHASRLDNCIALCVDRVPSNGMRSGWFHTILAVVWQRGALAC
jgi:hypothetical protein